jgi:hypothetical protein
MYHLFLSLIIIAAILFVLAWFHGLERGYLLSSWIPLMLWLISVAYEYFIGFTMLAHVGFHLAYDMSYFLVLAGIVLVLRAVIRKQPIRIALIATCVSSLPLAEIMTSQMR